MYNLFSGKNNAAESQKEREEQSRESKGEECVDNMLTQLLKLSGILSMNKSPGYLESILCTLLIGEVQPRPKKRKRNNNNVATTINCNSQLALFPIATKGNGIKFVIRVDFQPQDMLQDLTEPLIITIFKPQKTERSKKKSNSDPFELWQDSLRGEMSWDANEKCLTFTTGELLATTTNNTIYELCIQVKSSTESHSITFPVGIPSRSDQVDEFVDDLIEYHQNKMKELGYSKAEIWEWFAPIIRNSWVSFLGMKDEQLNMQAVKQGFDRHEGGD